MQFGKISATFRRAMLVLAAAAFPILGVEAQDYPTHTIALVVPFAAGGPSDVIGRLLANAMGPDLRQTMIVENIGGAGGNVGAGRVAQAAPDGYTLLYTNTSMAVSPALYPDLNYDPIKDFADIGVVSIGPSLLFARRGFPPNNFTEFIQYLKANGEKTSFGTTGPGGPSDLCSRNFMRAIATKFTIVPYKGTSEAMNDLIAGRLDLLCDSVSTAVPQVVAGNAKAYGIVGTARSASLPDIPTLPEAGIPSMATSVWTALYAPKNTPKPIVDRLSHSLQNVLRSKEMQDRVAVLGQDFTPDRATPEALAALLKSEIEKWTPLLKEQPAANQ